MSDIWSNLATGGAAILGALAGIAGTIRANERTLRATRSKDNFQIRKEQYEGDIAALSALKQTSDFCIYLENVGNGDPEEGIRLFKPHVREIGQRIGSRPSAFSEETRCLETQIKLHLMVFENTWNETKHLYDDPETSVQARQRMNEIAADLVNALANLYEVTERRLEALILEYKQFVTNGIAD